MAIERFLECRVVSITNVSSLSGTPTIDGIATASGDWVVLVAQTTASENGVWVVGGTWTRPTEATNQQDFNGMTVVVREGDTQPDTTWQCRDDGAISVGTDPLTFAQLPGIVGIVDRPCLFGVLASILRWYGCTLPHRRSIIQPFLSMVCLEPEEVMRLKRVSLFLLLFGLSFSITLAQGDKAIVVGTVSDTTGAMIPGAEVYMTRAETNEVFSAMTSDTGDYAFRALVSGNYELKVSMPGFKTEVRSGLKLDLGQTYRIDMALNVGEVAEVVEVQATTPVLKTETPVLVMTQNNIAHDTVPYFMERFGQAYMAQLSNFADNLLNDRPAPVTIHDGIEALRVAIAAARSFRSGKGVRVSSVKTDDG